MSGIAAHHKSVPADVNFAHSDIDRVLYRLSRVA
ncbi:unannotated protein [freshwater metagenome]|uniref:Unannotated protein n=1 Tax=freshwater metagenome TaxID=449393 RepID=A0A6J6VXU2_9ZZZZ